MSFLFSPALVNPTPPAPKLTAPRSSMFALVRGELTPRVLALFDDGEALHVHAVCERLGITSEAGVLKIATQLSWFKRRGLLERVARGTYRRAT